MTTRATETPTNTAGRELPLVQVVLLGLVTVHGHAPAPAPAAGDSGGASTDDAHHAADPLRGACDAAAEPHCAAATAAGDCGQAWLAEQWRRPARSPGDNDRFPLSTILDPGRRKSAAALGALIELLHDHGRHAKEAARD
jgi:hypothetical protein